ncbi:hypothetical protein ACOMHN_058864 [Nucella lapillus]
MFTKGDVLPSWTALSETIERYQQEQFVQLWRRDSRKLETAHKRFLNHSFNSELVYYEDGQQLELVNCHTHEISAAIYEHYPSQRQLDDDTKTEVANMLKVGANRKLLQRHVSEKTGRRVLLRDIHNLGYRAKSRPTPSQSEVTALADHLKTYPGLSSEFVIQDGSVAGIYLQDTLMLVDSTYKVNSLRMPLFLILVVDGNGESEVVTAFIVINECTDLLSQMVTIFKARNPAWESVNVILTDKDMAERKVFKDLLPQANLHICLFHVLRTFKREVSTEKMGITQEERTTALEIIQDICYARSEEQYQQRYADLQASCCSKVVEYFESNWHHIRGEWVEGLKHQTFSLTLLGVLGTLHNERDDRVINIYHKAPLRPNLDPISQAYQQLVTPYAFKRIHQQLQARDKVALGDSTQPDHYTADSSEGSLQVTSSSCTCTTFISTQLPCRHIFRVREHLQQELNYRWTKTRYREPHRVFQESATSGGVSVTNSPRPSTPRILSQVEKFRRATVVTQKLASLMSDCGMPDYTQQMQGLQQLLTIWEAGNTAAVVEVVSTPTIGTTEIIPSTSAEIIPSTSAEIIPSTSAEIIPSTSAETTPHTDGLSSLPPMTLPALTDLSDIIKEADTDAVVAESAITSDTNTNSTDSTSLDGVVLPPRVPRKGRPRGSSQNAIGLPSKRRRLDKPQPFNKKTLTARDRQMLGWFVGPDKAFDALNSQLLIGEEDVEQDPIAIPEACLDDSVNVDRLHRYFDGDGWTAKSQDPHWECLQCQQDLHTQDSIIRCDSCMMWFHLTCQSLRSAPKKKYWYCGSCK